MTAAATSHAPSGWADLPPDLLGDVSGRLHDAIDFTRFHAVCMPWREALLCQNAPRRAFLPYLVTPCKHLILRSTVDFGSVDTSESDTTCRRSCEDVVLVQRPYAILTGNGDSGERNWVACGDGSAAWIFTRRMLHNVLTGAVMNLPLLPEPMRDRKFKPRMEYLHGIVYGDGTTFLYSIYDQYNGVPAIAAAILPAGGTVWTFVDKELHFYACCSGHSVAAYLDGKILVCVDWHHRYVLNLDDSGNNNHVLQSWCIQNAEHKYRDDCFYVLESRCELLLVSILVKQDWSSRNADDNTAHAMSLRVHALEEQDEGGKVRWVARDGQRLGDRVLFLGSPASFAMDATQLGMDGGCAYFIFKGGLFKYRFINDEAKLVTRLHPIWSANMTCVWLQPRPHFRPSGKEIETPKKKNQTVHQI